jgi:hypothetical protein
MLLMWMMTNLSHPTACTDEEEEVEELEAVLLGGRGLKPGCLKSASMSVQRVLRSALVRNLERKVSSQLES